MIGDFVDQAYTTAPLFQLIGKSDGIHRVPQIPISGAQDIKGGDFILSRAVTTGINSADYQGLLCFVKTPDNKDTGYWRVFINGNYITLFDPSRNNEYREMYQLDKVKIEKVVTAIIRPVVPIDIKETTHAQEPEPRRGQKVIDTLKHKLHRN